MEAAIISILEEAKRPNSAPLNGIDLVACSSTLGNLLRYCSKDPKPFRMIVYKVGDAVHLVRREKSPREIIPDIKGYGHTFPDAFTTWDRCVSISESHQRIISYRLGGLDCLVRFEADGYLPTKNQVIIPPNSSDQLLDNSDIDELTSILSESTGLAKTQTYTSGPISTSSAGIQVDQRSLFDLKTRSIKARDLEDDILSSEIPRLWIRQVTNFVLAFHHRGTFDEVQVKAVKHELAQWEKQNQRELSHFSALLTMIVDIARSTNEILEVCLTDDHPDLQVRHQIGNLPDLCSTALSRKWAIFLENMKRKRDHKDGDKEREKSVCDDECDYCGKCV